MDDILINFGGEIKNLGEGKLGGYLVRFSTKDDPDLAGDFFTKDTDFSIADGTKTPLYLNHRQPLKTKNGKAVAIKQKIGEGTLTTDDNGILIEAVLFEREKYEKALEKLGWSSGTAAHLTDREKQGKAYFIKSWPLGLDASLTPRPCEPRNCLVPLKSLEADVLELPDNPYTEIKDLPELDVKAEIGDAPPAGMSFADRLDTVRAAVERVTKDATEIQEMRVKSGRVISADRRTRIQGVLDALGPLGTELQKLLDESEPKEPKSAEFIDEDIARGLVAHFSLKHSKTLSTVRRYVNA